MLLYYIWVHSTNVLNAFHVESPKQCLANTLIPQDYYNFPELKLHDFSLAVSGSMYNFSEPKMVVYHTNISSQHAQHG